MDGPGAQDYESIRKVFVSISKGTIGKDYRYLTPWSLFGPGRDSKQEIANILSNPLGINQYIWYMLMISRAR